ncbi:MAG: MBOAT family protein, partial [Oscillospiraceae bacterium]|nr:MBOAT family protein [Oscillospiraceae bacterium]
MLFNSVSFLIFFPIVVMGYFIIPEKLKNHWLLIASYYFYMSWQPVYALLILFSTATTFYCAVLIDKARDEKQKKLFLAVNIIVNIAILGYFKYFNFIVDSLLAVFPSLGIARNNNLLAVVGISFYTFQSLGYSIDVYRGRVEREKDFLTYALFVSFFPQLVAGPIERSANLLPQLHKSYKFEYNRVTDGLVIMAWGFFKKLVISDGAALIVNAVYNDVTKYTGIQLVMATFLFAFQIYCDFSGYSDIAVGAANVMGFKLMRNFNHPYFSQSVVEFWRNWHISLSGWFMDYVYFPLGGSRKGKFRTYINLMITFLVSGLWHGASWTFVIWGGINGIYNVLERIFFGKKQAEIRRLKKAGKPVPKTKPVVAVLKAVITFILIDFTWIFFRANNLTDAVYVLQNMFSDVSMLFTPGYFTQAMETIGYYTNNGTAIIVCIVLMFIVELWEGKGELVDRINKCATPVRWFFYYAV